MRASISLYRTVDNVFIFGGILGVINENNIMFLNMLGGNSIVLVCNAYNAILDITYDSVTSLLFAIDSNGSLFIFNTKLTISKVNSNECTMIYSMKVPISYSSAKLKLTKNILYIVTDNKYLGILDLNLIKDKNILYFNNFLLMIESFKLNNEHYETLFEITSPKILNGNSQMLLKTSDSSFCLLSIKHVKDEGRPYSLYDRTNSESWYTSIMKANTSYIYIAIIIMVSVGTILFKRSSQSSARTGPKSLAKGEPFSSDDQQLLQNMMKQIQDLQQKTNVIKNIGKTSETKEKPDNKMPDFIDELDEDDYIDDDDEEI